MIFYSEQGLQQVLSVISCVPRAQQSVSAAGATHQVATGPTGTYAASHQQGSHEDTQPHLVCGVSAYPHAAAEVAAQACWSIHWTTREKLEGKANINMCPSTYDETMVITGGA